MNLISTIILAVVCCAANFAQDVSIEKHFEKNRLKYKLEKFSLGEDSSSGYDYLIYMDKTKIVKVREIWSSSDDRTPRAEDYYYDDGKLVALVKYTFDKKYYRTAEKGRSIPLKMVERLVFNDLKLTDWTENDKIVPTNDKRWQEKEKEALEIGAEQLKNYSWLKENNRN